MPRYEYQHASFRNETMSTIIKTLNEKGSQGWRIVSEHWIDNGTVGYLLERQLVEKATLLG
jgi:hypothetical protein